MEFKFCEDDVIKKFEAQQKLEADERTAKLQAKRQKVQHKAQNEISEKAALMGKPVAKLSKVD